MNNKMMKYLLIALAAAYVISPVDAAPGPIDDVLVMLATWFVENKLMSKSTPDKTAKSEANFVDAEYEVNR